MRVPTPSLALLVALGRDRFANALRLAGGRYDATTDPIDVSKVALEAAAIKETDDLDEKKRLYKNGGGFSQYTGADGKLVNRSLASLSIDAGSVMSGDEWYDTYRYSFYYIGSRDENEDPGMFDGRPVERYGDTIVDDLIDLKKEDIETEAALVTSVWMRVVHHLEEAARKCGDSKGGDTLDGLEDLDLAAAYYVGMNQEEGDNGSGHLLYNLAENAGERFGKDQGEVDANRNVLDLMNEIKTDIISAGTCPDSRVKFRLRVRSIVAQMTVPLVQNLIHYMSTVNPPKLELYGLALIPQVASCDPDSYDYLRGRLVLESYDPLNFKDIVARLQGLYPCFGVTCEDVGAYKTDQVAQCDDSAGMINALAGYALTTDVREIAYLDRDVLRMKNLMTMGSFDAARDVYRHGHNSVESDDDLLSLREIATDDGRSAVTTQYPLFTSHFDGDEDYADTVISRAFDRLDPFVDATDGQISEVVLRSAQVLVMNMYGLQELYTAKDLCPTDRDAALLTWEKGVAALVGSVEGPTEGGAEGGALMFALSKEMCGQFGTCLQNSSGDRTSSIGEGLMDALRAGATGIGSGDCRTLEDSLAYPTEGLLRAALVQGTLHFAAVNSSPDVGVGSDSPTLGSGHVLSQSIVPLIPPEDAAQSDLVSYNLEFDRGADPVPDGADAVFRAVASSLDGLEVDCEDVGVYTGVEDGDMCVLSIVEPEGGEPGGEEPGGPTPTPPTGTDDGTELEDFPPPGLGYTFTTGAEDHAKIAMDVKVMRESEMEDSKDVYANGKNARVSDPKGQEILLALSALSTDSAMRMGQDPLYNFYRYAFRDEPVFIEDSKSDVPDSSYGDTVVRKAYNVAKDNDLAAEAAVVIILFMEVAHQLRLAVMSCEGETDGARAVDVAAAFWVGTGQGVGDNGSGYLMYSIAERAAARYGQDPGEAAVNTNILGLLGEAKDLTVTCGSNDADRTALRVKVQQITAAMNVPLLQNLIYYMNIADSEDNDYENYIELYALSVVPQVAACNPSEFAYLKDEMIDYDWDPQDLLDIMDSLRIVYDCFGVTCEDLGTLQGTAEGGGEFLQPCSGDEPGTSLGAYVPSSEVGEIAKIDRDILQINITMHMDAFDAAEDIYRHGRNSRTDIGFLSLQSLATNPNRMVKDGGGNVLNTHYQLYSDYYGEADYADSIIDGAFNGADRFADASKEQLAEVVVRALQTMVTPMFSLQEFHTSVMHCIESGHGKMMWDRGAAALIGSIEGAGPDGSDGGQLMFALAKEECDLFGTCISDSYRYSPQYLMGVLTSGMDAINDGDCDGASDAIADVVTAIQVPLIQATLHSAAVNSDLEAGSGDGSLGAGFVFAESVLPFVDGANPTSAEKIGSNMDFDAAAKPVPDGADAVFDAMRDALSDMGFTCKDIGVGVCGADHPTADKSISDGLYVTTTYVEDRLKIAKDVESMGQALLNGDPGLAKQIYREGLNSNIYDKNGVRTGLRTLASFSTSAPFAMAQEPVFNIITSGLEDENGLYLGSPVSEYAHTIVESSFGNANAKTLAAEAAVALNLWAYVVHEMYQMVDNCKNKRLTDDDGIHSLDEAVAYYIGDSQQTGDPQTGHVLYALAEKMGEEFKTDSRPTDQSKVNLNIMKLFNQAKLELSFPDACVTNPETYKRLRVIVHKIVSQMTVPLMQGLILGLRKNDRDRVKLYAQAVVPLIAGCSPSTHKFLHEELVVSSFNIVKSNDYIKALQSVYSCLGISCEDVGGYEEGTSCADVPEKNPLAGYVPMTDVRQYAKLDLDILHARILMQKKAYGAVKDIYYLGQHAMIETLQGEELLSLEQLATTSAREIVPSFSYFERFFADEFDDDGNAKNYGHYLVRKALDEKEYPMASPEQRTEMVVKTLQYMVVYMGALQYMYDAVDDCKSNDSGRKANANKRWDRSAALLIGSLEGTEDGGNEDGMMMHNLANKRCLEFGRCNDDGTSKNNDELLTLLYAGYAEAEKNNCEALQKGVGEIESLLQVGLIQGTLRYAVANQKHQFFVEDGDLAEGYIFSRSVLPYVEEVDVKAAQTIKTNMDFNFVSKPVPDGAKAVFDAFAQSIPSMGVDCEKVGGAHGLSVCGTSTLSASSAYKHSSFCALVISVIGYVVMG